MSNSGKVTYLPPNASYTLDGRENYVNSGMIWPKEMSPQGLPPIDSFSVKFTKAGTFSYLCEIHPWMSGTVESSGPDSLFSSQTADWIHQLMNGIAIMCGESIQKCIVDDLTKSINAKYIDGHALGERTTRMRQLGEANEKEASKG